MGFSISAVAAILGVSLLISLEITVGSILPVITDVNDSFRDMKDRAINQIQTDIEIQNVSVEAFGLNFNHTIYWNNTGSTALKSTECEILINGLKQQFNYSALYIYPDNQVQFTVNNLPGSGIKRYKVITKNDISDYFEYEI